MADKPIPFDKTLDYLFGLKQYYCRAPDGKIVVGSLDVSSKPPCFCCRVIKELRKDGANYMESLDVKDEIRVPLDRWKLAKYEVLSDSEVAQLRQNQSQLEASASRQPPFLYRRHNDKGTLEQPAQSQPSRTKVGDKPAQARGKRDVRPLKEDRYGDARAMGRLANRS